MRQASVKIVAFSEQGVSASAAASRISTSPGNALEVYSKSGEREKDIKLIGKVLSSGHNTVIEHMYLTAAFNDVSVLTEQLMIEHRLASYTVKSRRYVDFSGAGFLIPDALGDKRDEYCRHMEGLFSAYQRLLENEIPREDARFVLPYCFRSNFIMSANAREMLLVASSMTRGRFSVYPEVKSLGEMLLNQINEIFPGADKAISRSQATGEALSAPIDIPSHVEAAPDTELLSATPNADKLLRDAMEFSGHGELTLRQLVRSERPRELELLNYTFKVKDVSLAAVTHFTRHRVQSLIVPPPLDALKRNAYVLPESVAKNTEALKIYKEAFEQNALAARAFLDIPEVLSYFALAGNTVDIVFNMNARELIHFLRLRSCNRAQWEIRAYANEMLCLLTEEYRELFRNYGPSCAVLGYCPEGRLSCGRLQRLVEE